MSNLNKDYFPELLKRVDEMLKKQSATIIKYKAGSYWEPPHQAKYREAWEKHRMAKIKGDNAELRHLENEMDYAQNSFTHEEWDAFKVTLTDFCPKRKPESCTCSNRTLFVSGCQCGGI